MKFNQTSMILWFYLFTSSMSFKIPSKKAAIPSFSNSLTNIFSTKLENYNDRLSSVTRLNKYFSKSLLDSEISIDYAQQSLGPVPRSYNPSILEISSSKSSFHNGDVDKAFDDGLRWYLDYGGRVGSLVIACSTAFSYFFENINLQSTVLSNIESMSLYNTTFSDDRKFFICEPKKLKSYYLKKIDSKEGDLSTLYDIIGRLNHDLGHFQEAIDSYTSSLLLQPNSSALFRNLGSAYHAAGNMQMSFASYQQALSVDPTDSHVYLKLAFFYEDMLTKDWKDALPNAIKCYEYYLEKVDPLDTSILTRLGNLYTRNQMPSEALTVYGRALAINPKLHGVWFNSAHAFMKLGGYTGAKESLERALVGDPTNLAAQHMLLSLSSEAESVIQSNPQYVKQLFDDYANDYDKHGKKLFYASPRVIRTELAKLYKVRYEEAMHTKKEADPSLSLNESALPSYLSYMEKSLDILDLGCGTGLAGSWIKDYGRSLVGVDLSKEMIEKAKRKMFYTELKVDSIENYLKSLNNNFATTTTTTPTSISAPIPDNASESTYSTSWTPSTATYGTDKPVAMVTARRPATTPVPEKVSHSKSQFDLVMAAEVLQYIGDVREIIQLVVPVVRKHGYFVFTAEALPESELDITSTPTTATANGLSLKKGFRLLPSGRFAYSKDYLIGILESHSNMKIVKAMEFTPRYDAGIPVLGYLFIVEKLN